MRSVGIAVVNICWRFGKMFTGGTSEFCMDFIFSSSKSFYFIEAKNNLPVNRDETLICFCHFAFQSLQRLDFATMQYNTHDIGDFPEYLVSKAKQLIDESDEIAFTPRQKMGEQIFGDIKIRKFNGDQIELVNELAKTGNVKKVDAFIPKGTNKWWQFKCAQF